MTKENKKEREPLVHIVKRSDTKRWYAWSIRVGAFVLSLLICAIVSVSITNKGFGYFFSTLFDGVFGSERKVWNLFHSMALLLIVALAVTPCFKMKFWNIGAEGQVLMGCVGCALAMFYFAGKVEDGVLYLLMVLFSILFAVVWAVIPAIFKAKWNTNETLFTLMMNYIASFFAGFMINIWAQGKGSGTVYFKTGYLPDVYNQFLLKIIVAGVVTVLLWIYLRYSKHGYELSVVGESERTAKYIGINVKKVIIRTMILTGVMCGIAGLLLVGGTNHNITETSAGGRGFTAILVSWLAHFNPFAMVLTAFLVVFIQRGTLNIATINGLGDAYADVMTGIFFFLIIASEFFINYKVVFKNGDKIKNAIKNVFKKKSAIAETSETEVNE